MTAGKEEERVRTRPMVTLRTSGGRHPGAPGRRFDAQAAHTLPLLRCSDGWAEGGRNEKDTTSLATDIELEKGGVRQRCGTVKR
jgi:hypothetical protein